MYIASVFVPRFSVEAERQRSPAVASRLVLVGDSKVLDCSLGADSSGVFRGMRMSEAIGLCPKAVVISPDLPYYQRRFKEMLDFLQEQNPDVEAGEPGHAYFAADGFDVGLQELGERLISSLHRALGYMASVGIASGKFVSHIAAVTSRPGVARVIHTGQEAAFLAPLPVTYLPAGEGMLWRLKLLGIEMIGQVAQLPLGAFQQQFGPEGKRCWELASGIDNEPLVPRVTEEVILRRVELSAPTASMETILAGLQRLLYAAYADRSRRGHRVRRVIARGVLDGGGAWELPVAFREALADPKAAWFAVQAAVTRRPPERLVEELEIELVGLSGESGKQSAMFEAKGKLWQQVEEAARHLNTNDKQAIGRIVEVEPWSRIPERRSALEELL
jgi:nucleotidyltransferase/DNA polymerase involved in DNA repair